MRDLVPYWSALRLIGRSRLARATIFIPIVGYFILFNEQLTKYLNLIPQLAGGETDLTKGLDAFTLSRLICLYIGLFCIGAASIIFHMLCPEVVAEHESEHAFSKAELDLMSPYRFVTTRDEVVNLRHFGSSAARDEVDRLSGISLSETVGASAGRTIEVRGDRLSWDDWLNRNHHDLVNVTHLKYQLVDRSNLFTRAVILFLYCAGFVFLLYPSAEVFLRALSLLKKFVLS